MKAVYKAYGERSLGGSFFDEWFGMKDINLVLGLELVCKQVDPKTWLHIEAKLKASGLL